MLCIALVTGTISPMLGCANDDGHADTQGATLDESNDRELSTDVGLEDPQSKKGNHAGAPK